MWMPLREELFRKAYALHEIPPIIMITNRRVHYAGRLDRIDTELNRLFLMMNDSHVESFPLGQPVTAWLFTVMEFPVMEARMAESELDLRR